jgi:hypothetical protein
MRFATRWILSLIVVPSGENASTGKDARGRWEDSWVKLGIGRRLGSSGMVRMLENNPFTDSAYVSSAVLNVEKGTVANGTTRGSDVDDFASVIG